MEFYSDNINQYVFLYVLSCSENSNIFIPKANPPYMTVGATMLSQSGEVSLL